jgi:transcriptional regulator with XRE-family HTH domain
MSRKLVTPGDYIHDRRRDVGLTKGEMARCLGLADGEYRQIERDERRPSEQTVREIAQVLRMDPRRLLARYGPLVRS